VSTNETRCRTTGTLIDHLPSLQATVSSATSRGPDKGQLVGATAVHVLPENNTLGYLPRLAEADGVELAEIAECGHLPMYARDVATPPPLHHRRRGTASREQMTAGYLLGVGSTDRGDHFASLLEGPSPAILTTYRRDGSAVSSPVWFRVNGGVLEVVIAEGDVKLRHLARHPSCGC
jgi:hypothetical protein